MPEIIINNQGTPEKNVEIQVSFTTQQTDLHYLKSYQNSTLNIENRDHKDVDTCNRKSKPQFFPD
jgi:hypothetical protein